ncbi:MAG: family 78 glycoside hydrolase catalytic domain [Candidatus Latescibacterota bacterium]
MNAHCATIRPERLRCEYHENPLGIDAVSPRLAWIVVPTDPDRRGLGQTAYQILVAGTWEQLDQDRGDLWDSGRVESSETIHVCYGGSTLTPGQLCWWKVRAWDRQGRASSWSDAAAWTMGLLGASGGNANWIGPVPRPTAMEINPDRLEMSLDQWALLKASQGAALDKPDDRLPLLRREFDVSRPIRRAIVSVCGLGHYELRLNGHRVGDHVLDPGWTDYRKTCLYATYDVTDQVRRGENCLGVMLGNGMYHERGERYWKFIGSFGAPKMILHLRLDFADGTTSPIVSDDAWRVAQGPITLSSIFGGEDYDARLEQPGWDQYGFDDTGWQAAVVVEGPGGRLVAQSAPPIKVIETFSPVAISEPTPGVFVHDLGQNFSGWPKFWLRGHPGAKVRITPAEALDEKGLADQGGSGGPCSFSYTLKGGGIETWHPQFSYYGFRYLQIEGAVPENKASGNTPVLVRIEGQFTRSSSERVGSFACSDDLMNRIYRLVDWAIGSNLQSMVTDCPHREKLGWLEIAHLTAPSAMFNYDVAALYAKIARDMTEAQQPSGLVPTTAPEYSVFSEMFRDSPEWSSAAVIIPWQLYQWYGDRRILTECYPMMKRYVAYLASRAHDHIIAHGLGDWGDFPNVEEHMGWAQLTPLSLTGTAIYYYDTAILAKVAAILGKPDDAQQYEARAEAVRGAFNHKLFNPRTNRYASGTEVVANEVRHDYNRALFDPETNEYVGGSQVSQAMPLALGLVEPDRAEAVFANLVAILQEQEYVTAGDVGHRFLLRALAERGRSDLIFALHSRTTEFGYGFQIAQGLTALGEAWDGRSCASMNHGMLGHIQEWFHADVLGIQCAGEAVAFKRIVIRPQIVGDLRWARGAYDSIRGTIAVDWQHNGGQLALRVTIPANTTATVYVPTTEPAKVLESGNPAGDVQGVTPLGARNGVARYQVGSGNYVFSAPWQ